MKRRTLLKAAIGAAVLAGGSHWLAGRRLNEYTSAALAFGTTISLRVLHDDETVARTALTAALDALKGVERLMSLYRQDSQLTQLNRNGELTQPDARLVEVLQQAQAMAEMTEGAFDVTVQPLWLAGHAQGQPAAALQRVGWRKLEVRPDHIRLAEPGMALTLNGIAQGYGVDVALAALRAHGIRHALIDTGELGPLGRRDDGQPWTLGIRDPRNEHQLSHRLEADGRCLATSGDYASAFNEDFSRHHIVDPRTGESPPELASVSVLAPTGIVADALSTACMVLGTDASMQLAARMPGIDLLCIRKNGDMQRTVGFPVLPPSA